MSLDCTACKGTKVYVQEAFTSLEGRHYAKMVHKCHCCNGVGSFEPVDVEKIMAAIVATRGKNKGTLRASMTSPVYTEGADAQRAYYVWRLARFHGGVDMSMPMMAGLVTRGDPFLDDLEKLADEVAKKFLGSDMRAAARWHRAFYG